MGPTASAQLGAALHSQLRNSHYHGNSLAYPLGDVVAVVADVALVVAQAPDSNDAARGRVIFKEGLLFGIDRSYYSASKSSISLPSASMMARTSAGTLSG